MSGKHRGADEDGVRTALLDILGEACGEGGAVLDGAGEALDELDHVRQAELFSVMRGHADEHGLGERGEDAEKRVFGLGIGFGVWQQREAQGTATEGKAVLEDVVDDVVFDDLRLLVEEAMEETFAGGVGFEDLLFGARGGGAEALLEVVDALDEPR
jgi:hypothetical protein